ncbi:MAG TPA: 1-phosphofructokinase family hexose kinase [Atribacteraceae bacterium]|nr:1-phosphofructokinase family hexose kinase [Atribacteraceae bacterium]
MILTLTLNPCIDKTLFVNQLASGDRIVVREYREIAGGKGSNVCRVLKGLGGEVVNFCLLAGYTGDRVSELLQNEGIQVVPYYIPGLTRMVTTVVEAGWRQTSFFEPPPLLTNDAASDLIDIFVRYAEESDMVVACGSLPNCRVDLYQKLFEAIPGKKTVIDGRGEPLMRALKAKPWLVKMNIAEAEETWRRSLQEWKDLTAFFLMLREGGVEWSIVTFGERGVLLSGKHDLWAALPPRVETVNPVGSGDAFLAAFLHTQGKTGDPREWLAWGVAAGAANAAVWDAAHVDVDQVERLLSKVKVFTPVMADLDELLGG